MRAKGKGKEGRELTPPSAPSGIGSNGCPWCFVSVWEGSVKKVKKRRRRCTRKLDRQVRLSLFSLFIPLRVSPAADPPPPIPQNGRLHHLPLPTLPTPHALPHLAFPSLLLPPPRLDPATPHPLPTIPRHLALPHLLPPSHSRDPLHPTRLPRSRARGRGEGVSEMGESGPQLEPGCWQRLVEMVGSCFFGKGLGEET